MNTAAREDLLFPLLSDVALFDGLSGEQLRFLAAECFTRRVCKGGVIFEKDTLLGGFFAVREGRVKLAVLAPDGGERVVQIALAGDTIGESLGLLDRPSPVYAQALCSSSLLFFRAERVRVAALRWPSLGAAAARAGLHPRQRALSGSGGKLSADGASAGSRLSAAQPDLRRAIQPPFARVCGPARGQGGGCLAPESDPGNLLARASPPYGRGGDQRRALHGASASARAIARRRVRRLTGINRCSATRKNLIRLKSPGVAIAFSLGPATGSDRERT